MVSSCDWKSAWYRMQICRNSKTMNMICIKCLTMAKNNKVCMKNILPFFLLYLPQATFTFMVASSSFVDVPSALSLVLFLVIIPDG